MTAGDAAEREPRTVEHAVALDRLAGEFRAGGREAARTAGEGTEHHLVRPDREDRDPSQDHATSSRIGRSAPASASTRSISLASSWCGAPTVWRVAISMSRNPTG